MSIIKQIKTLSRTERVYTVEGVGDYGGNEYTRFADAVDLIRLAGSHERLLGDARRALISLETFKDMAHIDPRVEDRYDSLKAAIEEAEKI